MSPQDVSGGRLRRLNQRYTSWGDTRRGAQTLGWATVFVGIVVLVIAFFTRRTIAGAGPAVIPIVIGIQMLRRAHNLPESAQ